MNVGKWFETRSSSIPVFTWVWAIASIVVSSYFAFCMFPGMLEPRATIYFQTQVAAGVVYWPNSGTYRNAFLSKLSDKDNLYYSACAIVPTSQDCDQTNNWYKLDPKIVRCTNVADCTKESFGIPDDLQSVALIGGRIRSVSGTSIAGKDPKTITLSDPAGWGNTGKWPIFFVALFSAVKLGRSVGEFLFTPYHR